MCATICSALMAWQENNKAGVPTEKPKPPLWANAASSSTSNNFISPLKCWTASNSNNLTPTKGSSASSKVQEKVDENAQATEAPFRSAAKHNAGQPLSNVTNAPSKTAPGSSNELLTDVVASNHDLLFRKLGCPDKDRPGPGFALPAVETVCY